jgi:NADP-dependent 3-hydroxy acid dehydrogenase YdfG
MLVLGNKDYGLSKSIYELYPDAEFCSRSSGYDLSKKNIRDQAAEKSLDHEVVLVVSALGDFNQTLLVESIIKKWIETDHTGYLIALGSSADTPVKGSDWIYPVEKRALRNYMRQLSQIVSSETPKNFRITYLSPGNLHTPKQDLKKPGVPKLDTAYVASVISWLLSQPKHINFSEICLDRIQKS